MDGWIGWWRVHSAAVHEDDRLTQADEAAVPDGTRSRAALLSFVWPGLGQLYRHRIPMALIFAVPPLLAVVALALAAGDGLQILAARLLVPEVALTAMALIALLAAWRVVSIFDARRTPGGGRQSSTRRSMMLALFLSVLVVACHGYAGYYAFALFQAGGLIHEPAGVLPSPTPHEGEGSPQPTIEPGQAEPPSPVPTPGEHGLINVLVVGNDRERGGALNTDSLIVASYDPDKNRVVMISLPRDTAQVPMYDGSTWHGKINSLFARASSRPDEFPAGGMGTLLAEMGYLVGIDIPYYISVDIPGFRELIDVVGGVDVVLDRPINDHTYQFTPDRRGFSLEAGEHHLDGATAEAYVRSRHGTGNSDFARARRQQQVLLALRDRFDDPQVLVNLPTVLDSITRVVRTNVPLDQLPEILQLLQGSHGAEEERIVLGPRRYAERIPPAEINGLYALRLKIDAVAALSIELFGDRSRYAGLPVGQ
jgi:LCP family protein required for cell wall assembly